MIIKTNNETESQAIKIIALNKMKYHPQTLN